MSKRALSKYLTCNSNLERGVGARTWRFGKIRVIAHSCDEFMAFLNAARYKRPEQSGVACIAEWKTSWITAASLVERTSRNCERRSWVFCQVKIWVINQKRLKLWFYYFAFWINHRTFCNRSIVRQLGLTFGNAWHIELICKRVAISIWSSFWEIKN